MIFDDDEPGDVKHSPFSTTPAGGERAYTPTRLAASPARILGSLGRATTPEARAQRLLQRSRTPDAPRSELPSELLRGGGGFPPRRSASVRKERRWENDRLVAAARARRGGGDEEDDEPVPPAVEWRSTFEVIRSTKPQAKEEKGG